MRRCVVRKDSYHDSVKLMQVSAALKGGAGVADVVVAMATPYNVQRLVDLGWTEGPAGAGPNDLVVAIDAVDGGACDAVEGRLDELLRARRCVPAAGGGLSRAPSRAGALAGLPEANVALISLPGRYAALEARKALACGLHVMLFSDNVPLDAEVELKTRAVAAGRLLMGPDCGTAILDGVPLCFANEVRRGAIGIVGAAGTGIQEVSACIDRLGEGVSHAIGTGGRDLSVPVGARTFLQGIAVLAADPGTKVIVAVSKPPAPAVAARVLEALQACGKPCVAHFVGGARATGTREAKDVVRSATLEDAARDAVTLLRGDSTERGEGTAADAELDALAARECEGKSSSQRFVRGYFAGGTLCDEALFLLSDRLAEVRSNIHPDAGLRLADPRRSEGHSVVDLGDDCFTVGRPHPMIDPTVRTERMEAEADDAAIAVVLLDVVLGHGAHADPAGALLPAVRRMRDGARRAGGALTVIASVVGTDRDPQDRAAQVAKLRSEGVAVMPANASASRLAALVASRLSSGAAGRGEGGSLRLRSGQVRAEAQGRREHRDEGPGPGKQEPGPGCPESSSLSVPLSVLSACPEPRRRASAVNPDSAPSLPSLPSPLRVLNLGLESFAQALHERGVPVVHVDWRPPAAGDAALAERLDDLVARHGKEIHDANQRAVELLLAARPRVARIGRALDEIPGMRRDLVLHAGPPVTWERMCGPMRGAVVGGLLHEGLARDRAEAEALAASGRIAFEPCHHHAAVGPMAGVVTASMPVWVVEDGVSGGAAFATLNEGLGKVLRYGAFGEEVLERLRWMRDVLAPVLGRALERHGPIELRPLIAQALQMGDELHNRNRAATSLLLRELAPHLARSGAGAEDVARVFEFIHGNDHFFLNLSMAAAKASVDPIRDIPWSTIVAAMARNGTDFGVRIAGLGERWFTAPSPRVEGLYLPGYGPADAAPDIGDSVITETVGIGGCAMAAAPAIVRFVGGTPEDAVATTLRMYGITFAENDGWQIPALDFRGTPTGFDLLKIVETGIVPAVNTGIAHKEPGVGMVGAGLVRPPLECFLDAARAFIRRYGTEN
ncbi:MAG: acyl-CoA synthetase FdrA [Acidobacteria bacterium]|nr:acyl-CoA synthetase FdrA [Acidobacteriota bacterium]